MRCSLLGSSARNATLLRWPHHVVFSKPGSPGFRPACRQAATNSAQEWQNAFLTAPVWRFWLGADISGATVAGAIMPSLDGVGRYYPLTLLVVADPSHSIPPPDFDAQDPWFAAAEEFLLATLDQARSFEDISAALDAMTLPLAEASVISSTRRRRNRRQTGRYRDSRQNIQDLFLRCVRAITGLRRQRASGGRKVAKTFLRWRWDRGECRIHFAIPSC